MFIISLPLFLQLPSFKSKTNVPAYTNKKCFKGNAKGSFFQCKYVNTTLHEVFISVQKIIYYFKVFLQCKIWRRGYPLFRSIANSYP